MSARRPPGAGLRAAAVAAVAAAMAAAPAATARTAGVRAGEHAAFTRLVIDAPAGARFAWGVADGRLVATVEGAALDAAPARRARGLSRVAGLAVADTPDGSTLTVELACPCGARVERLGDGRIVIDIAEGAPAPPPPPAAETSPGPAPGPAAAEAPAPAPSARAAETAPRAARGAARAPAPRARPARAEPAPAATAAAPPATGVETTADAAAPAPSPPPPPEAGADAAARAPAPPGDSGPAVAAAEAPPAPAAAAADETAAAPAAPGGPPNAATLEAARRQLIEQLTRAAEEGLVALRDPAKAEPGATATPPAADDGGPAAEPQIRARTAVDIAAEAAGRPVPEASDRPGHCLRDAELDLAAWSGAAPFAAQAAAARRGLVGEFDEPDPEAVLGYVRLLVRHGFGVEARAAMAAFVAEVDAPPFLRELSYLTDFEVAPEPGPLEAGLGCPGRHGLWAAAAAARRGALDAAALDLGRLREAIAGTPEDLRARAATPIAAAALDQGALGAAEALAALAARSEPPPPEGDAMLTVLLARLDAARGEWRRAEGALAPLLARSSEAAAEAMIRLVEFRVVRRAAPPRGLAETMEAMAFEQGATPLGRRLLAAAAQARALGDGLGPALAALAVLAGRAGDAGAASAAARDMLVDYEPAPKEAAAYAEAVLAHWALVGDGPEGDRARVAVARRLAALGLGNLGDGLLAPALARGAPAARLAAAEAATLAGEPERALGRLEGLAGPDAARARAAALAALFRYDEAVAAAAETGDAGLEARYAWLAGDWRAAAAAGEVDKRVLAAWMAGEGDLPPELRTAVEGDPALAERLGSFLAPAAGTAAPAEAGPLENAREALDAAQRRREQMRSLLTDG